MSVGKYDLAIIGGGPGGSSAAVSATKTGHKTVLIEGDKLGGTCLNYGCDPTKTMIEYADLFHRMSKAAKTGVSNLSPSPNWENILHRATQVQYRMRGTSVAGAPEHLERENPGLKVITGYARFVNPHRLEVNGDFIEADHIIIASGTRPIVPDVPGLTQAGFITNIEAVSLAKLPERMTVIGGGVVGIEFAQMFGRFGVETTVIESGKRIMETEDAELVEMLTQVLEKEGIRIVTSAKVRQVTSNQSGKYLIIEHADGHAESLPTDKILVAAGRTPNLEKLNLQAAGVKSDDKGIAVDRNLCTNISHIWAVGDVIGKAQFAHAAEAQAKIAVHNAFAARPQAYDDAAVSWVSFSDPELAHMGKTESELQRAGVQYTVARQSLDDIPRYIIKGQTCGLVKLLLDKNGKLLGGHILSENAGELLMPLLLLKQLDQPVTRLNEFIIPYPTAVQALAGAAEQFSSEISHNHSEDEEPEAPLHYLEWAQRSEQVSY
jgi:pyruvate/2-oxoglutarate dehydrogenase complex dihydrolipoamide dehydrogenase (E3) component